MNPDFLLYAPTVYCVGNRYQIVFITQKTGAGAVIVGGKRYTDNFCGVVRTASRVHRVEIKMELLDQAGSYTVEFKDIPDRTPYHPQTASTEQAEFSFRPIPKDGEINCYVISDTHGNVEEPTLAGSYFGEKLDLLILGGDMGHNVTEEEGALTIAELSANIAKGEIPVIFIRGNHDTRGAFAEFLPEYVGTDHGLTYFSIRLGRLWFTMLDTGEDNSNGGYGDIADYEDMWDDQVRMLEEQIRNADKEYRANGVQVRIALCHVPFTRYTKPCGEIFLRWTELLNQMKVHLMISGHTHSARFTLPEKSLQKDLMPDFPCVECVAINRSDLSTYKGTALIIGKEKMTVRFTDVRSNVVGEYMVDIK